VVTHIVKGLALSDICPHHLTQNDQIWHGNTYGDGRVLGQPRRWICTNVSRGLSAIVEFLIFNFRDPVPLSNLTIGLDRHDLIVRFLLK